MKNIQIERNLFAKIYKYFFEAPYPDNSDADEIRAGLEKKMNALIARECYNDMIKATGEEKEKALKEYLSYKK